MFLQCENVCQLIKFLYIVDPMGSLLVYTKLSVLDDDLPTLTASGKFSQACNKKVIKIKRKQG